MNSEAQKKKIKAYRDIMRCLDFHADVIEGSSLDKRTECSRLVEIAELSEVFGFDIPAEYGGAPSSGYIPLSYGGAHQNEKMLRMDGKEIAISWPDNDLQPENEWLYVISFSTGAYFFGDHYPQNLFRDFFLELKSLGPKFTDTQNNCLYFSQENAAAARESLPRILKKYRDIVRADKKRMEIDAMEKRLEEIKSQP